MPSASHVSNITVNVLLQALATTAAGFGTVTFMVDEAEGAGNGLGGARYMDFADDTEVATALAAAEITAQVAAACNVAFSQPLAPTKFRVGRVDTVAVETYSDAYALLIAEAGVQGDVYAFCADTQVSATIAAFALTIEASGKHIYIARSADADWKTAGLPAALTAIDEYARTIMVYHDVATAWLDIAVATRALAYDADTKSVPWENRMGGVAAYTTFVTDSIRTVMQANDITVLGTWGSTDFWADKVATQDGRPAYERLTADWFEKRVEEAIQTFHQRETEAGRKVLVNLTGQAQIEAVIRGVTDTGEAAGHFTPGQVVITGVAITDADRTARRLQFTVQAQVGIATRLFVINANFSTTAVVS